MDFRDAIVKLHEMGLDDVILPFILIFTLVFGILHKSKVLGEKKNIQVMIAFVFGLTVVIPHVLGRYGEQDPVIFLNRFLPYIALGLVVFLSLLFIMGVFGFDPLKDLKSSAPFVVFFAISANAFIMHMFPKMALTSLLITILITVFLLIIPRESSEKAVPGWLVMTVAIIVVWIFFWAGNINETPIWMKFLETDDFRNITLVVGILVIAGAMVTSKD